MTNDRDRTRPGPARLATALAAAIVTLAACGGGEEEDPGPMGPVGPTPARVAFQTQPVDAVAGVSIGPAIRVAILDADGEMVTGSTVTVTVALDSNPGGATLLGTTAVNAVDGIATFDDLRIEHADAGYTLTAASGSLAGATSAAFAVAPGAPADLEFLAAPAVVEANTPLDPPVQVAVRDAFGNPITDTAVQIELSLSEHERGGALAGILTADAADGVATFAELAIDRSGTDYELKAAAAALDDTARATLDVTFTWMAVTAGSGHTCGLQITGRAYCWGENEFGELGDGETGVDRDAPGAVQGGLAFTAIDAGIVHTCALTPGQQAYCWGFNGFGQLGHGSPNTNQDTPVPVEGGPAFAALAASGNHGCGLTAAGEAHCWGMNNNFQLGDGSPDFARVTPGPVGGDLVFDVLRAGNMHNCALTAAGTAYCWGSNDFGQLGDGDTGVDGETPDLVQGGLAFTDIHGGIYHTCALTAAGTAYCWGRNDGGQLGDGEAGTDRDLPDLVLGDIAFSAISGGQGHTCALAASGGEAYCWGSNDLGQLGDGQDGMDRDTPDPVLGARAFDAIGAGSRHTCALTPAGEIYCWGANNWGQLGAGDIGFSSDIPVRVLDP